MPPRSRKPENDDLPDNVYTNKVGKYIYYYYEDPVTLERTPLGRDREAAIEAGNEANDFFGQRKRVAKVKRPISSILDEWLPKRLARLGSEHSQKRARNYLANFKLEFGKKDIRNIETLDLSKYLDTIPDSYRHKVRTEIKKFFDYALSRGYLPHNYGNPAAVTEYTPPPKPKRKRLEYDQFQSIYALASAPLKMAMDVMLHTTMRPSDALRLKHDQIIDGKIYTHIRKTDDYLAIELSPAEQKLFKRSRLSGIASPYVIHKMPKRPGRKISKSKDHPTQCTLDELSKEFSAIRDKLGINAGIPAKQKTSLYEIRSLAARRYMDQGKPVEEVQKLMAHTDKSITIMYAEDRRINYVNVRAGLAV